MFKTNAMKALAYPFRSTAGLIKRQAKRKGRKIYKEYIKHKYQPKRNYKKISYTEKKILGLTNRLEVSPSPIQTLNLTYVKAFVLGDNVPVGWNTTGLSTLSGVATQRGDNVFNRDGKFIKLLKTHIQASIDMSTGQGPPVPYQFRVMVVRQRKGDRFITTDWGSQLLLDTNGNTVGHTTGGITGFQIMNFPINKRDWTVYRDYKFMLSPTSSDSTSHTSDNKYPSMKEIVLDLKHNCRAHYPDPAGTNPLVEPDNYNFRYLMIVYARALQQDATADRFEMNVIGTTSFTDV